MNQATVERIEPTSVAKAGDFLRQEWAAFYCKLLGLDELVRWEKRQ